MIQTNIRESKNIFLSESKGLKIETLYTVKNSSEDFYKKISHRKNEMKLWRTRGYEIKKRRVKVF